MVERCKYGMPIITISKKLVCLCTKQNKYCYNSKNEKCEYYDKFDLEEFRGSICEK